MPLVTLIRRLPESLAKCAVNPENVQWVGTFPRLEAGNEVVIKMLDGPELLIAENFDQVVRKLNGGSNALDTNPQGAQENGSSTNETLGDA